MSTEPFPPQQVDRLKLTCSICLELFWSPRLLPCHHTFCLECLRDLAARHGGRSFPCPSCRKIVLIPPGGVEKFQVNFYLMDDIERHQEEILMKLTGKPGTTTSSSLSSSSSEHVTHRRRHVVNSPTVKANGSSDDGTHSSPEQVKSSQQQDPPKDLCERISLGLCRLLIRAIRALARLVRYVGTAMLRWYLSYTGRLERLHQKVVFAGIVVASVTALCGPYVACGVFVFELCLYLWPEKRKA